MSKEHEAIATFAFVENIVSEGMVSNTETISQAQLDRILSVSSETDSAVKAEKMSELIEELKAQAAEIENRWQEILKQTGIAPGAGKKLLERQDWSAEYRAEFEGMLGRSIGHATEEAEAAARQAVGNRSGGSGKPKTPRVRV